MALEHDPFVRVRIPTLGVEKDVRRSAVMPGMEVLEDKGENPYQARRTKRITDLAGENVEAAPDADTTDAPQADSAEAGTKNDEAETPARKRR